MSQLKRYMKNIYTQYGKNIKSFENMNLDVPDHILELYEKHGLDINSKNPMLSIMIKRWRNNDDKSIDSYDKIKEIANDSNNKSRT